MRKTLSLLLLLAVCLGCQDSEETSPAEDLPRGQIITIAANPTEGFHWPYQIFIPENLDTSTAPLLVLPNNTGVVDDDLANTEATAVRDLNRFAKRFTAGGLKGVLLQPIFPRFRENMGGWRYYTHALDRDCLLIGSGIRFDDPKTAITVTWVGPMMGEHSGMSFNPADLFVIQDGLVSKCVAVDCDPRTGFSGVDTFTLTVLFDAYWDPTRAFNIVEYGPPEDCFRFIDVRQTGLQIHNAQAANAPEFRITAIAETNGAEFDRLWDVDSEEILDADMLPLKRLDLQLIAMVDHARGQMSARADIALEQKFSLYGFSAAGSFSDRFAALNPEKVNAVVAGGYNGLLVLPQAQINGVDLRYPLGLSDYEHLSGHPFNRAAFAAVKRYYYLGADDTNDTAVYRDSFAKVDETLIFAQLGPTPVSRVPLMEEIFKPVCGENVTFRVYEGVGHQITDAMRTDLFAFLLVAGF